MLKLAEKYAKLLKTKIIEGAFKENEDGSITFVLVSGPKLTMTEKQLRNEIAGLETKANLPAQIEELEAERRIPTQVPVNKTKKKGET